MYYLGQLLHTQYTFPFISLLKEHLEDVLCNALLNQHFKIWALSFLERHEEKSLFSISLFFLSHSKLTPLFSSSLFDSRTFCLIVKNNAHYSSNSELKKEWNTRQFSLLMIHVLLSQTCACWHLLSVPWRQPRHTVPVLGVWFPVILKPHKYV